MYINVFLINYSELQSYFNFLTINNNTMYISIYLFVLCISIYLHTGSSNNIKSTDNNHNNYPYYTVIYTTATEELIKPLQYQVPCSNQYRYKIKGISPYTPGCSPGNQGPVCGRYIQDNFLTTEESRILESMINEKIFSLIENKTTSITVAGPSIADINTGYIRSSGGKLYNMYRSNQASTSTSSSSNSPVFTLEEYTIYRQIITKMRQTLEQAFQLKINSLYFTAPTFITRTIGSPAWKPLSIHDEYYHPHVDKANTAHYDYSALLYLSTFQDEKSTEEDKVLLSTQEHNRTFTGGKLAFLQVHPDYKKQYSIQNNNVLWEDKETYELLHNPLTTINDYYIHKNNIQNITTYPWYIEHIMEPKYNRLVLFSSGLENIHQVQPVLSGTRIVLSLWFTCDEKKEFINFLDGNIHNQYVNDKYNQTVSITESLSSTAANTKETLQEKQKRLLKQQQQRRKKQSKLSTKNENVNTNDNNVIEDNNNDEF